MAVASVVPASLPVDDEDAREADGGVTLGLICNQFRAFMRNVRPVANTSSDGSSTRAETFLRIALQLPDAPAQDAAPDSHDTPATSNWQALHLEHASAIATALGRVAREFSTDTARPRVFVLGDTSFGSCCVDAVAAEVRQSVKPAANSLTVAVPSLYILDRVTCAEAAIAGVIAQQISAASELSDDADASHVLLLWEPAYAHAIGRILTLTAALLPPHPSTNSDPASESFVTAGIPRQFVHAFESPSPRLIVPAYVTVALPGIPPVAPSARVLSVCGLHAMLPASCVDESTGQLKSRMLRVLHIGTHAPRARMLAARFADTSVTCIRASSGAAEAITAAGSRVMAARYRCVEAVRNASIMCIVVCTLTLTGRNEVVAQLRAAAQAQGKHTFVILVGKPSHTKLGNFPDMDVFVCVACPEHTLMDERVATGVRVPIATPQEAFVGLDAGMAWTGTSLVDFTQILSSVRIPVRDACDEDECGCSGTDAAAPSDASSTLARRDATGGAITVHTSEAAARLARRQWRGLQYDTTPETAADTRVHQGASGIARAYSYETQGQGGGTA